MHEEQYWDNIYGRKAPDQVSWYRPRLDLSLQFIGSAGLDRRAPIIDVGGGASTLVDDLLTLGYSDVTILDLSAAAIEISKKRLGERAEQVHWIVGDVTRVELPQDRYAFWHDRAVFHFLADPHVRRQYVNAVERTVTPGGHIVVATFGLEGPTQCSGLEVVRYSPDGLHAEFGSTFQKITSATEAHRTPWGTEQQFVYCYCLRRAAHLANSAL